MAFVREVLLHLGAHVQCILWLLLLQVSLVPGSGNTSDPVPKDHQLRGDPKMVGMFAAKFDPVTLGSNHRRYYPVTMRPTIHHPQQSSACARVIMRSDFCLVEPLFRTKSRTS